MVSKDVAVKTGTVVSQGRKPLPAHFAAPAPLPSELEGLFTIEDWFTSLTTGRDYVEPNPDYMAQRMLYLTLMSGSAEEVLSPSQLVGLQDLIPNAPGQETGPITITDLYVAASDQADGNRTYLLFSYVVEATQMEVTTTTGATHFQAQIMTLLALGNWPIRVNIRRGERQDKGGRYMLSAMPWDGA